jgi:hypothetical protein
MNNYEKKLEKKNNNIKIMFLALKILQNIEYLKSISKFDNDKYL